MEPTFQLYTLRLLGIKQNNNQNYILTDTLRYTKAFVRRIQQLDGFYKGMNLSFMVKLQN